MSIRKFLLTVVIAAVVSFILGYTGVLQADPRMETNDGFCHMQISRNNANNEVFVANCRNDIYQDNNGQGFGYAIERRTYPRGRTPIGNVRGIISQLNRGQQRPPGRCRFSLNQEFPPAEPIPIPAPGQVGDPDLLLCTLRLTDENTPNQDCNLVDSNNTQYATNDWTAVYRLYADGTVEYRLDCRNADQQN